VPPDLLLLTIALGACLLAAALSTAAALVSSRHAVPATGPLLPSGARVAWLRWIAGLPLAILGAELLLRAAATGRPPIANLHEVVVALAAAILALHLVFTRGVAVIGIAASLGAAALVGFAMRLPVPPEPLVPALQAPLLLAVHVGSAILAYAAAMVAGLAAVGELIVTALGPIRARRLPSAAGLRSLAHRSVLIALPLMTGAIALGSIWANLAWRSYWSNDPKELSAAATWLLLGAYLHAVGRRDRWGRAAPWLAVAGLGAVLFTLVGASLLFGGQHSYAQV
jgi:ABC-type transport system involved in cytochrome c biogenesis permease subunit